MKINLIAVGTKMPAWVTTGFQDYAKRFPKTAPFQLIEIEALRRGKQADIARIKSQESESLLLAHNDKHRLIVLDVKGITWSTEQLAEQWCAWESDGRHVDLFIGGPDGLSKECLARADQRWSLSPLTLPHPLVRIVVIEQLYRAVSLINNHPYHRA